MKQKNNDQKNIELIVKQNHHVSGDAAPSHFSLQEAKPLDKVKEPTRKKRSRERER